MEAVTPLDAGTVDLPLAPDAPFRRSSHVAPRVPPTSHAPSIRENAPATDVRATATNVEAPSRLALDRDQRLALRDAVGVLVSSRALVWVAGVAVVLLFGFGPSRGAYHPPGLTGGFGPVGDVLAAPAARWDGAWYLTIAHYGYLPELGPFTAARAAFFPLYPLLIWAVSGAGIAGALAGVIVSLIALLVALYALHRLTMLELGSPASRLRGRERPSEALSEAEGSRRRVARLALLLTAFGPMAFFLSADYSEALYLALSIGVLLQARRGNWGWAGILGGLAAATRSTGVLLLLPALVLYLYGPREDALGGHRDDALGGHRESPQGELQESAPGGLREDTLGARHDVRNGVSGAVHAALRRLQPRFSLRLDALPLLLIPIGLLSYIAWFSLAGGEPLTPLHAQALWGRHFAGPFVAVWDGLKAALEGARQLLSGQSAHLYFPLEGHSPFIEAGHNIMLFAFLALAVPMVIGVLRRLPFAYGAYVIAALALPLSYPVSTQPLMSLPRFLLVLFPLTMWLAAWLAPRRGATYVALGVCALALAFFTGEFSSWHWVA